MKTFQEHYGVGWDSPAATDARDAWNAALKSNIDWRQLLVKYIAHVGQCEGDVFLHDSTRNRELGSSVQFTDAEWVTLQSVKWEAAAS